MVREVAAGGALLDRKGELAMIHSALARAREGEAVLLWVEGAAGIGKTRLLDAATEQAREDGFVVLTARCSELEQAFGFGAVRQLLERRLAALSPRERDSAFAGAAAFARAALIEPPARPQAPTYASLHGLYWLVVNLASQAPLLIAVDDVHWCDAASARWLYYLALRLEGLPVAVLVAARESGRRSIELDALRSGAAVVSPAPLGERAAAQLLRRLLGGRVTRQMSAACHSATGGNPFLLTELARALRSQGVDPAKQGAEAAVVELGPPSISRAVLVRLSSLPPAAVRLARAASVLGEGGSLLHAANLAGLAPDRAAEVADAMVAADVLASAQPIRFLHPVVRAAIYTDLPHAERATLHLRAAGLLADDGRPLEERAAHLLRAPPRANGALVTELRQAAGQALARGAPETAATYLRRALDEPPAATERASLLLDLGHAEMLARDVAALEHFAAAVAASEDPRERAAATRARARMLAVVGRTGEAVAELKHALDGVERRSRLLRLALASDLAFAARIDPAGRLPARERTHMLRALLGDGTRPGATGEERLASVNLAVEATMRGEPADACIALVERGLVGQTLLAEETADSPTFMIAVCVLIFADRYDRARELLTAAIDDAHARGSLLGFGQASCFAAMLDFRDGALADAEATAAAAADAVGESLPQLIPLAVAALVDCLRERGETAEADSLLSSRGLSDQLGDEYHHSHLLEARGRLRLAQGRAEQAVGDFREAGERQERLGMLNPAIVPWRAHAALALAALGERGDARELVREELKRAQAFGAARALGVAQWAAGLVAGGEEGIAVLQDAVATLGRSPARLDHARALVELGATLRRLNRRAAARQHLADGLKLAQQCGASVLAERALEELAAAGARTPRRLMLRGRDALTPSELRIAKLAAEGKTNSEIAQTLFVTLKTVEGHLHQAYRKLEITGRSELAESLNAPTTQPAASRPPTTVSA